MSAAPPLSFQRSVAQRTHPMVTRSQKNSRLDTLYVSIASPIEPTCFTQANKILEWHRAMADEFNALQRVDTWVLVPRNASMNIFHNK